MAKAFKKGQLAIYFMSLDGKGTFIWTRALVKSCGEKKMTLENAETGAMMGSNFRPTHSQSYQTTYQGEVHTSWYSDVTLPDMDDEAAQRTALELAAAYLVRQKAMMESKLTSDVYNHDAVRESMAALHEPRAEKR